MDVEGVFPETVAGAACDETAGVLAWSAADDVEEPARQSWRGVCGKAAAVLAVCVVTAVAMVLLYREQRRDEVHPVQTADPSSSATKVASPSTAQNWPVPYPPSAEHLSGTPEQRVDPEADDQYLAALQRGGMTVINRNAAIAAGHSTGRALTQGRSDAEIAASMMQNNSSFDKAGATATIAAAVAAYCPGQGSR